MQELAQRLTLMLGKPVVDKTDLTGRYDFMLHFERGETLGLGGQMPMAAARGARGPAAGSAASGDATTPISGDDPGGGPTLQGALEKQLGLKLEETDSGDCGDRSRGKSADSKLGFRAPS